MCARSDHHGSKVTHLRKDLVPAEGGGQDQEGQDEFMQSAVRFNGRQNLGSRAVWSAPALRDGGARQRPLLTAGQRSKNVFTQKNKHETKGENQTSSNCHMSH